MATMMLLFLCHGFQSFQTEVQRLVLIHLPIPFIQSKKKKRKKLIHTVSLLYTLLCTNIRHQIIGKRRTGTIFLSSD